LNEERNNNLDNNENYYNSEETIVPGLLNYNRHLDTYTMNETFYFECNNEDIIINMPKKDKELLESILDIICIHDLMPIDRKRQIINCLIFCIGKHNIKVCAPYEDIINKLNNKYTLMSESCVSPEIKEVIIEAYNEHCNNHLNLVKQTDCLEILFDEYKKKKIIKDG